MDSISLNCASDKALCLGQDLPSQSNEKALTRSLAIYLEKSESCKINDHKWEDKLQTENDLKSYPTYSWKSLPNNDHFPEFEEYRTISRHLCSRTKATNNACPYGDNPAPIARIVETKPQLVRDAYTLSALRFKLSPFKNTKSTEDNKRSGIPTVLTSLYARKIGSQQNITDSSKLLGLISQKLTLSEMKEAVAQSQQEMRFCYAHELAPLMNANPFDPELHYHELTSKMVHDLRQYVELQNRPYRFFNLVQQLEKDVALNCWRAANTGELLLVLRNNLQKVLSNDSSSIQIETAKSMEELLSILRDRHFLSEFPLIEKAIGEAIGRFITLTMSGWRDPDGHRRKRAITCPIGVPLGYMQALRRKDQPYVTQEFSNHAHGGLNHWLQEHIWQRFCSRYREEHKLHPSEFLKQLGRIQSRIRVESEGKFPEKGEVHNLHMFADAIYELHMPNLANPANTNFWTVLQFYLPLMSPWP
ncbi:MAG: hypothetical protein AAF609_26985 [Cyanobacteria bacterium P01_C01_bin.120]